ncbi:uncharacterized protein MELLADRAFT_89468 [Melampsora larici-populina 98AG31]|uniref:Uncharacterized protein n=1 Tax=Melampsora larici-populina (strain 98AG31 / pathotype 3-4-7) TaxID=747676 RepID=F4RTH1_MELLP|nr:uncharacterized protein MELLADRAFT_89468 [Melampsora larici-populina 98AG31]EGG04337.1 hypothetical protein MELLADRAFT_89468 [Melampsora larici-populina 98AG31]
MNAIDCKDKLDNIMTHKRITLHHTTSKPILLKFNKQLLNELINLYHSSPILLCRSGDSVRSAIVKQIIIIQQNGYTQDKLLSFKVTIYKNLIFQVQLSCSQTS